MDKLSSIPSNWKWVTLNDIGIIVSGGTPSTREPQFWGDEFPWITPADLSNYNEVYISRGKRNISKIGLDYSSARLLPPNSILFSSRAPIGYVAISKNELATNQGFKNLVINDNLINPKYIFYYLKTIKEFAENMASGTTFLELSGSKFKEIPFPLAPIEEQNKIVEKIEELFSELDKSIENLKFAKSKSILNISSLLKKMFENNLNWTECKINELCQVNYGKNLTQRKRIKGEVPVYGSNGIIDYHNEPITHSSTIIIGRKGSVGELHYSEMPCFPIDTTYFIEENPRFNLKFIFYQLQIKNLPALNTSTTIPGLNRDIFYDLTLKLPNGIDKQNIVVNIIEENLSGIYELQRNIDTKIILTKKLYLKILQAAFSGKLSKQSKEVSSIDKYFEVLKFDIDRNIIEQIEGSKQRTKTAIQTFDLLKYIDSKFGTNPFSYFELSKNIAISNEKLHKEFDILLNTKHIVKYFDEESTSIKYKKI